MQVSSASLPWSLQAAAGWTAPTAPTLADRNPVAPGLWPAATCGALSGVWEQAFWFVVPGAPRSKSNYRQEATSGAQWAQLKAYADQVALAARAARPRGWVAGDPGAPVVQRPVMVAAVFVRSVLDVGNADKSILDAVAGGPARGGRPARAGVVMASDAQVAASFSWGERAHVSEGALVAFARLHPGAPHRAAARAGVELVTAVEQLLP